jgi:hypothetical protein
VEWSKEMDAAVESGIQKGLSAREIGEALGVTRNSVLGRVFRLNLAIPHKPKKAKKSTTSVLRRGRGRKPKVEPTVENIEIIMDMKDMGYSFREIGETLDIPSQNVRNMAIVYGGFQVKHVNYFTDEEVLKLCNLWKSGVPVEDIADRLGRSFGVVRQKALQLKRAGMLAEEDYVRDSYRTRLLKRYGEKALELGATPQEALHNINRAKQLAVAEAINNARQAARAHRTRAITQMKANFEGGMARNRAIFLARADGARLEEIAAEFSLTRERVRQICYREAETIALEKLAGENND